MTVAASTIDDRQAYDVRRTYGRDPAKFMRDALGAQPYAKQIAMIESVRDHEQTTVVGANAVGKDWMVGRIILWWLSTRSPAKVIVTGPTARQVSDIVWRETRGAYYSAPWPLGGTMLPKESRWDITDDRFALGFSTDKPFNLTGFHSPNLLVIVTEAHNFSDDHMTGLKRLLPTRLLLSGNPFSDQGEFYDSHHDKRHLYNAIAISAHDTPNVINDNEAVPGLVTNADIRRMKDDWGEESPLYKATVDGEFQSTEDGLIKLSWLLAATNHDGRDAIVGAPIDAGVDVAGPGEDETVLTIREGASILMQKSWRIDDPRGEVVKELLPFRSRLRRVNVDSAGIGWNFYTHLLDLDFPAEAVNVGESSNNSELYMNLKAQLYWGLRQRFAEGDVHGLPREAVGQLASLRYKHNARGQVQIESKDEAKKRGVKSPDKAESIMLAFAEIPRGFEIL